MKVTGMYIEALNALIRSAKLYQRENDMNMYRQEFNEAYGMVKGLYMMDFLDDKTFGHITDKVCRLTEVTEGDFFKFKTE